ncbi:hypothetical protein M427DRAFT_60694 [Gonapodya prolifera JEL478]|uniref:Peptidase M14 domain-containing protein n=1 Tax=Gonapodya prolifera (strain JEL478) TaxID=1344416 RepID=A0A139A3S2_GONPJ|nr:hypothetical protein M427DRAFT_60694 [Gonapodya prolifera JEL478]|eukprot:KXS11466.1 hypothetical protein M427DRAFT_60694 [Gonapodya prolifera JEL478]
MGLAVDVRIPDRETYETVAGRVRSLIPSATMQVLDWNIQAAIDAESDTMNSALTKRQTGQYDPKTWFTSYHRYSEIAGFFTSLASSYPTLVSLNTSIGKSYEGRDLFMARIGTRTNPNVKQVYIQGLIHAREWVAGSTVQYLCYKLASAYANASSPDHAWAVKTFNTTEFYVVPVVNPDGYEYTWTSDRLWRKNRRRAVSSSTAVGVDLNRNYPAGWGTDPNGASTTPSDEDYQGPSPLSEPETKVVTYNFLSTLRSAVLAIDFHSYSQLILRSPGYNYVVPSDQAAKFKAAGDAAAAAIQKQSGKVYTSQPGTALYPATGSADDWAYSADTDAKVTQDRQGKGRVFSYTIELRPSSSTSSGFVLPPAKIVPAGEEIWAAVKVMVDYVMANII